jgi:hypothetical protein
MGDWFNFYTLCRYVERNAMRVNLVQRAEDMLPNVPEVLVGFRPAGRVPSIFAFRDHAGLRLRVSAATLECQEVEGHTAPEPGTQRATR